MATDERSVVPLTAWLERLLALLPPDRVDGVAPAEQAAVLDLARVAAHTSERLAAPISAFAAGIAFADLTPDERATRLRDLVRELENGF